MSKKRLRTMKPFELYYTAYKSIQVQMKTAPTYKGFTSNVVCFKNAADDPPPSLFSPRLLYIHFNLYVGFYCRKT